MSGGDESVLDVDAHTIHRVREPGDVLTLCDLLVLPPSVRADVQTLLADTIASGSSVNLCRDCFPELA